MIKEMKEQITGAYTLAKCEADARRAEEGQGTAEYAVLIGLILTVCVVSVVLLAKNIAETVDWANGSLDKIQTFTHEATDNTAPVVSGGTTPTQP